MIPEKLVWPPFSVKAGGYDLNTYSFFFREEK